jgi:hypothetical protein
LTHQEAVVHRIEEKLPDFFGLSETWSLAPQNIPVVESFIKHRLGANYKTISDTPSESQPRGRGTAIIIRKTWLPFINSKEIIRIPGCMTAFVIKRKSLSFLLACIYIPHDKAEAIAAHDEIRSILIKYKLVMPVVLTGDFNGKLNAGMDHFQQELTQLVQPLTTGDKQLHRLLKQNCYRPMQDSFRVLHPTAMEFSNFHGGAKNRIDLAIMNDLAMNMCTQSTIDPVALDEGVSHRVISITLEYSTAKLEAKPQRNAAKETKINWKLVTNEMAANLLGALEKDPELSHANSAITESDPSTMTRKQLQKLVNNTYSSVSRAILRLAKAHLPIIKKGQNPVKTCSKLLRLRADRLELVKIISQNDSVSYIDRQKASNRLGIMFDKYNQAEPEERTNTNKIRYIHNKINQQMHKHKRQSITEKIRKRQAPTTERKRVPCNILLTGARVCRRSDNNNRRLL